MIADMTVNFIIKLVLMECFVFGNSRRLSDIHFIFTKVIH